MSALQSPGARQLPNRPASMPRLADRLWLFGDAWIIVDRTLLWLSFRSVGSGLDPTPFPRLGDHGRRCEQRQASQRRSAAS